MTASARAALAVVVGMAAASACGSADHLRTASTAATTTTTSTVSATTSVPNAELEVTVPDCGSGAYRPPTLLIVCGSGGIIATGLRWTTWNDTVATASGIVHLKVGGVQHDAPATLQLSDVSRPADRGPQFSRLMVTWTGASPDGHPSDTYRLGEG